MGHPDPTNGSHWLGQAAKRVEDEALLKGEGRFVADISLPGDLAAAFVRSAHAHARIRSIDTSAAAAASGVVAIFTHENVPRTPLPPFLWDAPAKRIQEEIRPQVKHCDQYLLPSDKVRHTGEAVVMIVAQSRHEAEDAGELIEIDYEILPAAASIEQALEDDAPLVHDQWGDNVAATFGVKKGDPEAATAEAAIVIREEFAVQRQVGLPLEGRGAFADYKPATSELSLWSSTQNVHPLQKCVAKLLGLPRSNVRVIAPDVGGGFGTKGVLYPEDPLVAFASQQLGRPVKWVEDRIEHMQSAIHAREQQHSIELAVDSSGRFLAVRDDFIVDNGAFTHIGIAIPYNTIAHLMGPYRIPHMEARATAVMSHRTPTAPYRGAGRPEAVFALERAIERAARTLGIDALEIRRKNLVTKNEMPYDAGILYRTGEPLIMDGGDFPDMLDRAGELIGYDDIRSHTTTASSRVRRGVGFAGYVEGTGVGPFEGAHLTLQPDGKITLSTGACSQGQGHRTILAQIAADQLGVDPSVIDVRGGDTQGIRFGWGTIASRSAVVAGNAAAAAAADLRVKILEAASSLLEADQADLTIEDGSIHPIGAPQHALTFEDIATLVEPGPDHAVPMDGLSAEHYFKPPTVTWASGIHAAVVDLDLETGVVTPVRYVVLHDCGRPINPTIVKGQIHGGVAQGLGGALLEEVVYDEGGQILTVTLADYMIPTSDDLPHIQVEELDTPSAVNPLGVKGIGEGGTVPVAAAIANAVEDALRDFDIVIRKTPVSPSYVLSLISQAAVDQPGGSRA